MKKWLHSFEVFVDKLIPILLLLLFFIIIGEIIFHEFMVRNHAAIQVLDWFIIVVFAIDLLFKYFRMRDLPKFLRASWIEILALFPFFLIFRLFDGLAGLFGASSEAVSQTQKIVHVGAEIERDISVGLKEAGRAERFARFIRPIARSFRFLKLENPKVRKETKKDLIIVEKEAKRDINKIEKETEEIIKKVENVPRHVKAALFYEKPGTIHSASRKEKLIKSKKYGK